MITLVDTTQIRCTPEKVFEWLINIRTGRDYQAWHPDHIAWTWFKGKPFEEGSIAYSEEYLHGEIHKLKLLCTKMLPNRLIEYKPLFPWSVVMLKSSFYMEAKNYTSCIFTATINFREAPFIKRIFRSQFEAIKLHMKEEGEYLKL